MDRVHVHLDREDYPIYFADGKKGSLAQALGRHLESPQWIIITNPTVDKLHGAALKKELKKLGSIHTLQIPDGEKYKNLQTVEKLYKEFLKHKVDRSTPIIAFGGGVVGDVAGFAAATYLRGLPLIQIPTTLLAQVDSSVGGKTGVDLTAGKNLVGAFHQPKLVYIDVSMLKTLPQREMLCGSAEVIKYGAIASESLFSTLEKKVASFLHLDSVLLKKVVKECVKIKANVVERDEKETLGIRSVLNFGHTLGHAVETLSGYKSFSHGEAVAIGMAFAVQLSESLGLTKAWTVDRLMNLIHEMGLPHQVPAYSKNAYLQVMARDKKMEKGKIRYVLLKKIGMVTTEMLPINQVGDKLEEYLSRE